MDGDSPVIPLARLKGYRVASGALDMRGWQVYSDDGRPIGDVDELMVDPASMQVRFLDVEVEKLVATGRERHVLIPVGHARPDPGQPRSLVVRGLEAADVPALPSYARGRAVRDTDSLADAMRAAPSAFGVPARVAPPVVVHPLRPTAADEDDAPAARAGRHAEAREPSSSAMAAPGRGADPRAA